jgi:hypothetical protein
MNLLTNIAISYCFLHPLTDFQKPFELTIFRSVNRLKKATGHGESVTGKVTVNRFT